jgi:hypothetical protein
LKIFGIFKHTSNTTEDQLSLTASDSNILKQIMRSTQNTHLTFKRMFNSEPGDHLPLLRQNSSVTKM